MTEVAGRIVRATEFGDRSLRQHPNKRPWIRWPTATSTAYPPMTVRCGGCEETLGANPRGVPSVLVRLFEFLSSAGAPRLSERTGSPEAQLALKRLSIVSSVG